MVATALILVTPLGTFYRSRGVQKIGSRLWVEIWVWKLPPEHCGRFQLFVYKRLFTLLGHMTNFVYISNDTNYTRRFMP